MIFELGWSRMTCDFLVHQWLCEHWLIKLVMAEATIADEIDNNIVFELLSVFCCELKGCDNFVETISIDVEDRAVQCLCEIRRVDTRARFVWVCCKADLVIDNDMNCTTNFVVLQVNHLHGLVDDTLTCERSISVNENGNYTSSVVIFEDVLEGTGLTKDDWINSFKM